MGRNSRPKAESGGAWSGEVLGEVQLFSSASSGELCIGLRKTIQYSQSQK